MGEKYEDHARHIFNVIMKRRNPSLGDVEKLAEYLEANFANSQMSQNDDTGEKKSVGGQRKGKLPEDLPLVVAVFGNREAELCLRQKLADECGFSKNTAKARIEETRHALSDPDGNMRKIMAENGISSLARKRDG